MDIQHFFLEQGQGTPLLLLHGNGESSSYFNAQLPEFAQRFHVYAVDTRGHGKTPRGTAPFTISQFSEDLCGFMDEHGIERAHLLGFSDGGNIALTFALRYPERVDRLILNGANLDPRGVKRRYQWPIELGYRMTKRFSAKHDDAKQKADLLGLMVNEPHIDPKELAKLNMPTLVIAGTRDMIRDSHTRLIADSIPNAKLSFLDGDHFIAAKRPTEFNDTVLSFLSE